MEVKNLVCPDCNDNVGIAWLDGNLHAVCHCTHQDSDVRPVPLEVLADDTKNWVALRNGKETAENAESSDNNET